MDMGMISFFSAVMDERVSRPSNGRWILMVFFSFELLPGQMDLMEGPVI